MSFALESAIRYFRYVNDDPERAQEEQGNWRLHVYQSGLAMLLAYIQPWPDQLCPNGFASKFWDFCRAAWMNLTLFHVARLAFDVPGVYSG